MNRLFIISIFIFCTFIEVKNLWAQDLTGDLFIEQKTPPFSKRLKNSCILKALKNYPTYLSDASKRVSLLKTLEEGSLSFIVQPLVSNKMAIEIQASETETQEKTVRSVLTMLPLGDSNVFPSPTFKVLCNITFNTNGCIQHDCSSDESYKLRRSITNFISNMTFCTPITNKEEKVVTYSISFNMSKSDEAKIQGQTVGEINEQIRNIPFASPINFDSSSFYRKFIQNTSAEMLDRISQETDCG